MKINLEKIIVFSIVIIIIFSSYSIYGGNIGFFTPENEPHPIIPKVSLDLLSRFKSNSFIAAADYYNNGDYERAKEAYMKIIFGESLNQAQKTYAYNKLAMCYFNTEEYTKSARAFLDITKYDEKNSTAYNNAAVSYYKSQNTKEAIENIEKAIEIFPAVEYFYNKGKIYEDSMDYENALKNFFIIINGESNLTLIDPISIKNRILNLLGDRDISQYMNESSKIALKLKEPNDTMVIADKDMDILTADFSLNVLEDRSKSKKLSASYDAKGNDPYHLINNFIWEVSINNKIIYTSNENQFALTVTEHGTYSVKLSVQYKGSKELIKTKSITINQPGTAKPPVEVEVEEKEEEVVVPEQTSKYYLYAAYEQLFENSFTISEKGVYDRLNVNWRKTNGIKYSLVESESLEPNSNALKLSNNAHSHESVDINLTSILNEKYLRGKRINLAFYVKRSSPTENMSATVRAGSNSATAQTLLLTEKYVQVAVPIKIPYSCNSLTMTLVLSPGDEVIIDGFMLVEQD